MSAAVQVTPATETLAVAGVLRHPVLLEGMAGVLAAEPDLAVVAKTRSVTELLDSEVRAPVVVLDVDGPAGTDCRGDIHRLGTHGYEVLAWSSDPSWRQAGAVIEAGARGYVTAQCDLADLAPAVRRVAAGQGWAPSLLPSLLLDAAVQSGSGELALGRVKLSRRELAAVMLYVSGRTMAGTAEELGVSEQTAKSYVDRAKDKFRSVGFVCSSKANLFRCLIEAGYPQEKMPGPPPFRTRNLAGRP